MAKEKIRFGLIPEVAAFFVISALFTGVLTYVSQRTISEDYVIKETERFADQVSNEVISAIKEYPAYEWLLRYWYLHSSELDIEYDADFSGETETEAKLQLLRERHPEFNPHYATISDVRSLPREDQKLYAEIIYSWLITRMNQIKQAYGVEFLFCLVTDDYQTQTFLLSAADPGSVRGTEYGQVYLLGTTAASIGSTPEAMRAARQNRGGYLAEAGIFFDYYSHVCAFDRHIVLVGLTYDPTDLREDAMKQTILETELAVGLQALLSGVILAFLYFFVLHPLKKVQGNIRLYIETKDSDSVIKNLSGIQSHNEMGQLSEDIIDLAEEIDDYVVQIETITMEKERIGVELSLASRIQAGMLPSTFPAFPDNKTFDIYASMDPAREVGGDFYDFFLIDDDHLCMVIADVSGKGIPAALFMMASKIILANNAMMGKSPAQILTDTNNSICAHNQEEMFVTVWLGILEISTGRLVAANAGHEYPALKRADGSFELVRDKHGFVIGGMEGMRYKEYEIMMEPGSKLFVYTDGLAEATNSDDGMFGTDRMLEALNVNPDGTPEEIINQVRRSVDGFVQDAEQFDDLTMMCVSLN